MSFKSAFKRYSVLVYTLSIQLLLMALFHFTLLALIQNWLSEQGNQQNLFFWGMLFLTAVPFLSAGLLSSTVLAFIGGYFLSWESLYYYLPCYWISSYIGYKLISSIDKGKTLEALKYSTKLHRIVASLKTAPFFTILFLRFSPVISFGQLTALCSFLKINMGAYLFASVAGMIPRTMLAVWAGIFIQKQGFDLSEYSLPDNYSFILTGMFVISLIGIVCTVRIRDSKPLY